MSKPTSLENNVGGLDLLIEKDAGNEIRILTGDTKHSLKFWTNLKELCEGAIHELKDKEKYGS